MPIFLNNNNNKKVYNIYYIHSILANLKNIFCSFIDLEKAYNTIDQHDIWEMLRVYGVRGKFLKAVQSFYVDSSSCVWVGMDLIKWFLTNLGLRQGCVMLNIYIYIYIG